ncbi:hypothetical protein [Deinococcus marmoris]|uniref:hypothetical protein n=1 Tax=Deinococcus marmoris TaxID=249408 RepID=UPI0012DCB2A9|nr:hypothetical protein [Deinococcus marmoris]
MTLTGLSAPQFDGVNFYRRPTAPFSAVDFIAQGEQFVQLEYQLYSPPSDVTGILKLDGRVLDQTTFPAGQFIPNVVAGAFVSAGAHRFTLDYRCQGQPCAAPISQYWTRLGQLPSGNITARQDAGLGVERWWLNAPASPLKITGTGPLFFDGTSFVRRLTDQSFKLSWTSGEVLNASMLVYGSQSFSVTTRVGNEVLAVQNGAKNRSVSPAVSLVGKKKAQSLTVQVDCLKGVSAGKAEAGTAGIGSGCAFLYFPQVAVLTDSPATALQTGGAVLAALLVITGLWRWLGLAPGRRAATG